MPVAVFCVINRWNDPYLESKVAQCSSFGCSMRYLILASYRNPASNKPQALYKTLHCTRHIHAMHVRPYHPIVVPEGIGFGGLISSSVQAVYAPEDWERNKTGRNFEALRTFLFSLQVSDADILSPSCYTRMTRASIRLPGKFLPSALQGRSKPGSRCCR